MFKASTLIVMAVMFSGCWTYPHHTEVSEGNIFGYDYEGNTPLHEIPDVQAKQVMAENIRDVKQEEGESWESFMRRKREASDAYLATSHSLNRERLFEGQFINEWGEPARITLEGNNGYKREFDIDGYSKMTISLRKGTYRVSCYLITSPNIGAFGSRNIVGADWPPMKFKKFRRSQY